MLSGFHAGSVVHQVSNLFGKQRPHVFDRHYLIEQVVAKSYLC